MDLRRLSYFLLACQEQGFAVTASELSVTQSTFSEALKLLAEEVGAPLLEQVQRRMHPTLAGLWLFRSAVPLLHAEEFFQDWIARDITDKPPEHLVVYVKSGFAVGRLTKAVCRAIRVFSQANRHVFVEPCFIDPDSTTGEASSIAAPFCAEGRRELHVEAQPHSERQFEKSATTLTLVQEPWVILRSAQGGQLDQSILSTECRHIVPALGRSLLRQVRESIGRADSNMEFTDDAVGILPRVVRKQPGTAYLLPRYLIGSRTASENIDVQPCWPPLVARLVAHHQEGDIVAKEFAGVLRTILAGAEESICFRPALSHRQMRYSRALFDSGSITAAARSLAMAQPALTDVLRKLELALDTKLFVRSHGGLIPTSAGRRLDSAATVIMEGIRRITVDRASVVCADGGRLTIGAVPAAAHTSAMPICIAKAIGVWRERFPTVRVQVLQGNTAALQKMVSNGTIALAITERTLPGMVRFKLADAEPLSLIANPGSDRLPNGSVSLQDVVKLPLALPTQEVGLRQILDSAVLDCRLKCVPALEVNSIPLTLALVRDQGFYTVLPASAVQSQIDSGSLRSHLIVDPTLTRQFYALHSGGRDLTEPERAFLQIMRLEFMRADNNLHIAPIIAKRN